MNTLLCLVLFFVSSCLADNHLANDVDVQEYAAIEKDLVSFNLFKTAGDWILRATTGNTQHTRLNINLNQNRVNFRNYHNDKLIGSGVWHHINGSKIIETDFDWKNKQEKSKLLVFHQGPKVIIYFIVRPNHNVALKVLVKNCETKTVDNQSIQKLITQLTVKPGIKLLVAPVVSTLKYVNSAVQYLGDSLPVNETDAIDWDLTHAVQGWTLRATTGPTYGVTNKKCDLIEDKLICNYYNEKGWMGKGTLKYLPGSNILLKKLYFEQFVQTKKIIAYADDNVIVAVDWINGQAHLSVSSIGTSNVSQDYINKVLNNQLLFSPDLKRVLKDLVPKLVWK